MTKHYMHDVVLMGDIMSSTVGFFFFFFFLPNSRHQVIHEELNLTFVSPKQTFFFIKMHNKVLERMQLKEYIWFIFNGYHA